MKYELLNKTLSIKIDIKLLDKINLFAISETAKSRVNFLIELNNQIKKSLLNNTRIDTRTLKDSYSIEKLVKPNKKTIRRLLNQLLKENVTYSEFAFTKNR